MPLLPPPGAALLFIVLLWQDVAAASASTIDAQRARQQSASYTLQDLQVEHLHAPTDSVTLLAIDVPRPRLSWRLEPFAGLRGVSQSAYRVTVKSAEQNIWDSGRVNSNQTNLVECCALAALTSDTEYRWSVTSWDHMGAATNSSSSFHTGLFNGSSWRGSDWLGAKWITTGLQNDLLRSSPLHLAAPVASASVFVAGVGYFELRVNGKRVGDGRKFDPGWTEYAKRTNYVAFDIGPFLRVGQNVIAVELGNSWYQEGPSLNFDGCLSISLRCSPSLTNCLLRCTSWLVSASSLLLSRSRSQNDAWLLNRGCFRNARSRKWHMQRRWLRMAESKSTAAARKDYVGDWNDRHSHQRPRRLDCRQRADCFQFHLRWRTL